MLYSTYILYTHATKLNQTLLLIDVAGIRFSCTRTCMPEEKTQCRHTHHNEHTQRQQQRTMTKYFLNLVSNTHPSASTNTSARECTFAHTLSTKNNLQIFCFSCALNQPKSVYIFFLLFIFIFLISPLATSKWESEEEKIMREKQQTINNKRMRTFGPCTDAANVVLCEDSCPKPVHVVVKFMSNAKITLGRTLTQKHTHTSKVWTR